MSIKSSIMLNQQFFKNYYDIFAMFYVWNYFQMKLFKKVYHSRDGATGLVFKGLAITIPQGWPLAWGQRGNKPRIHQCHKTESAYQRKTKPKSRGELLPFRKNIGGKYHLSDLPFLVGAAFKDEQITYTYLSG